MPRPALPGEAPVVPRLAGEVGAMEKMSRDLPAYVPEGLRSPPAYVDEPNAVDSFNDDQRARAIPQLMAQQTRNIANSPLLAGPTGAPLIRRPDIDSIMARSTDPRVSTPGYIKQYNEPATPEQIQKWDPIVFAALQKKAAENASGDENWTRANGPVDATADLALGYSLPGKREAAINSAVRTGIGNAYDMGEGYLKDIFDVGTPVYYPPKIEHPELAGPLGNYD